MDSCPSGIFGNCYLNDESTKQNLTPKNAALQKYNNVISGKIETFDNYFSFNCWALLLFLLFFLIVIYIK